MGEKEFKEQVLTLRYLMYGMALKSGLSADEAADAVQETQLRLWRRRQSLPGDRRELRMYCLAAMRNACIEAFRRRRNDLSLDDSPEQPDDWADEVEYRDTRCRIETLIEELPPGQSQTLKMSCFAGMETSEIAEATGQTETNVRQLLSRGRKKLKELWTRYESR